MKLTDLIHAVAPVEVTGLNATDTAVTSLHYRAQDVRPGGLFVAVRGFAADGHSFVDEACRRGAAALMVEKSVKAAIPVLRVADTRRALAQAAAVFFDHPSRDLTLIGVTGTNGKTSVVYILESILRRAGLAVGVIGTVNYRWGGQTRPSPHTTPEAPDLQELMAEMRKDGITHVVMEVASHGLALHRVDGCRFDVAVFTNLTQDHLDFHGDMEGYWRSKCMLFTGHLLRGSMGRQATAVINADDPYGARLLAELPPGLKTVTFGFDAERAVRPTLEHSGPEGSRGTIHTPAGDLPLATAMVGRHNVANILAGVAGALALNLPLTAIEGGIAAAAAAPGRLERVPDPAGRFIYVDYAHTPDALENVLRALRAVARGRLICVFGCGGDRDRTKRPLMGGIVARLSDLAVVTSDNPRTEAPEAIIADILPGLRAVRRGAEGAARAGGGFNDAGFAVEPDRRRAIALALAAAAAGDTVLIAGKGHETYQILGRTQIHFDDREEAAAALAQLAAQPPSASGANA